MKLEIFKEEDRITVAAILVKNGYTVRQFKERKTPKSKSYSYYIEAEKPEPEVTSDEG